MRRRFQSCLWTVIAAAILAPAPARADDPPRTTSESPRSGVIARAIAWGSGTLAAGRGDGFYVDLGHVIPGTGLFRGGPGYRRHLFGGRSIVDSSASVSARRDSMIRTSIEWPAAFGGRVSFTGAASYQDATQVNYFGIGAEAPYAGRTGYRIKGVDVSGQARVHLNDSFTVAGGAGMLSRAGIAPGTSASVPSIEQRFDEHTAPGLTSPPRYFHAGLSLEHDSRDAPGYSTRGGLYRVTATAFHDAGGSQQSFRRFDAEAEQYLPLYRDRAGIAVHGRLTMSQTPSGNAVPFYLLPTLGGGNTLRGFIDYRFRDRHAALLSVEYRWRVFTLMDAAVFADAGAVATSASRLSKEPSSRDYGFGVRLHSKTKSFGRVDIARGSEGTRVVFSISPPFGGARHGASAPYVP